MVGQEGARNRGRLRQIVQKGKTKATRTKKLADLKFNIVVEKICEFIYLLYGH